MSRMVFKTLDVSPKWVLKGKMGGVLKCLDNIWKFLFMLKLFTVLWNLFERSRGGHLRKEKIDRRKDLKISFINAVSGLSFAITSRRINTRAAIVL